MKHIDTNHVRLTPAHLDEIRASVDWQALFAGLGLRKAEGKSKDHDWWALSPFHEEKTPSFHMGPGGLWYDFSIGEGGGAIELVQKLEGCNCFEAGHFLLDRGWASCTAERSPTKAAHHKTRSRVRQTIEPASSQPSQTETVENKPIRQDLIKLCTSHEMLEERGVSEETCALLGIGYLPQGRSPLKGRIVFQVADARVTPKSEGELTRVILSHVGRAAKDGQEPKYLFYEGFHKSEELYAQEILWLHEDAEAQTRECGHITLTEGPFDVARAFDAGLRNVVGSFGASLSQAQALKLKEFANHCGVTAVMILFDRDEAGHRGALKAQETLREVDLEGKVFDWSAPLGRTVNGIVKIPETITDLAELNNKQITWLRRRGRI
ncbi:toprim domain-containing protein [Cohaesibacter gelatinilyticus]|uniref:Toprim domain-containing protein n=1 Tax=Cohaesibacter gelatinilyticus TaxID=372072 RepID=A0A285PEE5_9HYPH|nr:toprim domain-containing protein [Cohaesibacter gelatinilyticus]SNZ20085.1 Toprim domain-containing protein [Cohaesibacter gelatinilyticus]